MLANKQPETQELNVPLRGEIGSKQELSGSGGFCIGYVLSHCQRGTFVVLVHISIQLILRIQLINYLALLDGAVYQLLVELPSTVKGQNGKEFDFQSIYLTTLLIY